MENTERGRNAEIHHRVREGTEGARECCCGPRSAGVYTQTHAEALRAYADALEQNGELAKILVEQAAVEFKERYVDSIGPFRECGRRRSSL